MKDSSTDPIVPVACPDCRSSQLKGPDHPGKGLAYWRCLSCGTVWNPERPPGPVSSPRSSYAPRSTRFKDDGDYWKNR